VYSAKRLQKVGLGGFSNSDIVTLDSLRQADSLYLNQCDNFKSAEKLEEVRGWLEMEDIQVDSFRQAFPSLKRVGETIGISIKVTNRELKSEIETLEKRGEIVLEGKVSLNEKND
jgi:hypothetical protein